MEIEHKLQYVFMGACLQEIFFVPYLTQADLVFYHRILKCFVLIDLKKNSVQHEDIGQMNMYMGYFAIEENMPDDNPPIGIILSKNKD